MMEVDFTTWELSPLPGRKDPAYHAVASMGQFGRRNIGKITSLSDGEEFQTMRGGGVVYKDRRCPPQERGRSWNFGRER